MNKILILSFLISSLLYAETPPIIKNGKPISSQDSKVTADETLYKEIESILVKFDNNNNLVQKNIEDMKRLKKLNNEISKDNEVLMGDINTKCQALKILNPHIAGDVCKRLEEQITKLEEEKRVSFKFNEGEIVKRYPAIVEELFGATRHIEFQVKEEDGRLYAKRQSYSLPIEEYNKVEDGMFVMVRYSKGKFTATAYRVGIEDKWQNIK